MAKRGGVSAGDYKTYDAGTTIFTKRQNLDAFTPGTTPAHLNYQASRIADFMLTTGLVQGRPSLEGLLEGRFVQASES
jgi:NitT/TauT family transport system substrate-binding protein